MSGSGAGNDRGDRGGDKGGIDVIERTVIKVDKPSMYRVIIHNDDFTPFEFVVEVLQRFFNKGHQEAAGLMLITHNRGSATVGVYTREVAETKVAQAMDLARQNQHPLMLTSEKDS